MTPEERERRVIDAVRGIPAGSVASYGQVADLAGIPRGARQVGYVLRTTAADLPWHRVLTASGRIAFPEGSRQFREQARRLRAEDVIVAKGRVDMKRYRWHADIDELIWKDVMDGEGTT
ncbi:MAG: cysteine methyltransferase [Leptolyngbya sp. SIO1D8]|nr:cysteine methyltransferase [Leptolyngbya sp. SIO1D8]